MKFKDKLYKNNSPYNNVEILTLDLQGWLGNPVALEKAIFSLKPKTIIEVGSWKGESSYYMAKECSKYNQDFEIICIDTFLGSVEHYTKYIGDLPFKDGRPNLFQTFLSNMIRTNVEKYITPFQIDSMNAFLILKEWGITADLIYIDGGHDYTSVKTDILNYKQLVRKQGVIVCDDYSESWPEVKMAAQQFLPGGFEFGQKYFWINT
jgi:hypothetical protein